MSISRGVNQREAKVERALLIRLQMDKNLHDNLYMAKCFKLGKATGFALILKTLELKSPTNINRVAFQDKKKLGRSNNLGQINQFSLKLYL